MMNGLEQSDLAIVPMRAANKGTSVPAEPTEGRAGTKGNPRGQSTHRTQRRARVSQAAERIRQAATRKPKEKLTALLHHITTEALDAAYFSLKKEAAAGVDGVTWHEYGKGLAERLSDLHDRVQSGAYPGASVAAGRDTEAGRGEHDHWASPHWRTRLSRRRWRRPSFCRYTSRSSSDSAMGSDPDVGRMMRSTPWLTG